jgi:hypothetical protein
MIPRGLLLWKTYVFPWIFSVLRVHDDYAVGLPLSDAKEFAKDSQLRPVS